MLTLSLEISGSLQVHEGSDAAGLNLSSQMQDLGVSCGLKSRGKDEKEWC